MDLKVSLYLWAKNCEERRQQLQDWLDAAIVKIASGEGKTVASTTANGVSVQFMSNSLTIIEWVSALTGALDMLTNPVAHSKKAIQIFR